MVHPNTKGRELALQFLYMWDSSNGKEAKDFSDVLDMLDEKPEKASLDFARKLADAVMGHKDELDAEIKKAGSNWDVERMASVERNILRIGVAELQMGPAGKKIVINEAVELARKFGEPTKSPAFVNGVLDNVEAVS